LNFNAPCALDAATKANTTAIDKNNFFIDLIDFEI
jgi:hypothetical protein